MLRHKFNVHIKDKYVDLLPPATKATNMTFKHPFSMVISGPSGSGKSDWTRKLLLASLYSTNQSVSYGALDNGKSLR